MSIRMIAIDLDGTLLHDDMTISAYSREVIHAFLAATSGTRAASA